MKQARAKPGFHVGDTVEVKRMFPLGHIRTPRYIMGFKGKISHKVGDSPNPEELAYGRDGLPKKTLYRVQFRQIDVWQDYAGSVSDTLEIELYDHWLTRASRGRGKSPKKADREPRA